MSLWHGRNANCMPTMYDMYEPSELASGGDVTYDEQLSDARRRRRESIDRRKKRAELGTNEYEFSQLWLY